MSFTMRVTFEGLCVFFPESSAAMTEAICVKTPTQVEHAHTCQVSVTRGKLSGAPLPVTLDGHDVWLHDGNTRIEKSSSTVPHQLTYLPHFSDIPDFAYKAKVGVRRTANVDPSVNDYWTARIKLFDGKWVERDITSENWVIAEKNGGPVGSSSNRRLAKRLVHETVFAAAYARVECVQEKRADFWIVEPVGGHVDLVVGNYSHVEPEVTTGKCGESAHFGFALNLFEKPPPGDLVLRQAEPCRMETCEYGDRSLHLPCVGGCAC